jgi:type I restriction enzyme M protein
LTKLEDSFDSQDIVIIDEKTQKKSIKIIYRPKYKDNTKKKIFSPLRNKYLDALPEEIVRQEFICKLINEYDYTLEQMDEEVKLTTSQRGTGRASADLIIWKSEAEKKKNKTAFMVVELKAGNLKLKVEDCYQGYNYATWSRAKIFAISNGKILQVFKTIEEELPLKLQPVNDIPKAKDILDDKKLKEALAKTKEFTGEEFAKLLHKCHNIIRNNDKLSPEASFDEISKILFIKIMYERNPKQEAIFSLKQFQRQKEAHILVNGASDITNSYVQKLFNDVKSDSWFKDADIFDKHESIKLREKSFEQIVKELEIYNLTATSADVKGIAFEKFLGRTFRGELGQFFTPRVIVDFIVDLLDPKENELFCDPCAGSGGFLIKTFETIKKTIDDKFLEIKTKKQQELFGKELQNIEDENLKEQYEEFLTKTNKQQEDKITKLSHKTIFGTDANPRMARVSKMNMIMHGDGHNGIHHNDGLLNVNGIFRNRFDMIITNPPFGTNLDKKYPTVEDDDKYTNESMINKYLEEYGDIYAQEMKQVTSNIDKPIRELFEVGKTSGATEVLFIERCLDLLKAGGRLGIVLPEGVLNSSNLQGAREYFESRAKIILVVSLPQDIFISSGATVKTSLVFFKKFTQTEATEYEKIKEETTKEINNKYSKDIENIKEPLINIDSDIKSLNIAIKTLTKEKKVKHDDSTAKTITAGIASSAVTENLFVGLLAVLATKLIAGNTQAIDEDIKKFKLKENKLKEERKNLVIDEKLKLKDIYKKIENEIKEMVKEKFDYEISIADIKKAGITTTGAVGENQLPELLEAFTKYRKNNKLWDVKTNE